MKINVDIDCTPAEAREFLGLPDIKPIQDAAMASLQKSFEEHARNLDPEAIMKNWVTPGMAGIEQFQKAMWQAAAGGRKSKE